MENSNKPAYPFINQEGNSIEDREVHYGLTKREMFAMAAMQGLCANPAHTGDNQMGARTIAEWAIEQTDELLKQLER